MASFENDELQKIPEETDAQPYHETLHSKFQRLLSGKQSASVSIPMESYEVETSIVGDSGSLYATSESDNLMQHSIVVTGNIAQESTDEFSIVDSTASKYWHKSYDSINEHLLRSGKLGICNDPYCTTCPSYFKSSRLRNPKACNIPDPKFQNALNGDAKVFARKFCSLCSSFVPGVMNPHSKFIQQWNKVLASFCLVAIFVDPLFFFLLYVRQFRLAFVSPESRVVGAGDLVDHPKEIAFHYLKGYFLVDLFVVFPLPQRVNQCFRNACQSSHIPGCLAFIDCGHSHVGDNRLGLSSNQWNNNADAIACWNSSSSGSFSYGIYNNAVPLTTQADIVTKYIYALFWGLQQISTLAGNQTPSDFVFETLFTIAIIGLGLFLFALLIGNIQNFLQGLGRRRLEMQLRRGDVEQWMSHRRLPEYLRRRVRQAERYSWTATRGVNEATLMENFPEDLQVDIRRHLFKFVKRVRIFALMDEPILDAICARLRQTTCIKGSRILSQGSVVEKMVFVVRGKLESIGEDGTRIPLSEGDVCGEELLTWYLEHSSVSAGMNHLIGDPLQQSAFRLHGDTERNA
ncbi:cyclic nucleotide-gated ion channel 20 [Vigna angularis]|uniref:Cyclic nucleotide-gated ion channel 20 n=1 Tax=Phaseolus angularis TaxID=3914 RepID=A0A8T0JWR9_PHAAN|nr:cyclic nucleotide-gated ion channel 20 [Vigna angularis]